MLPQVNCHTHTFTGDHVPPYLGKKILPLGLGYIFTIPLIVGFFRWYYKIPDRWRFSHTAKSVRKFAFKVHLLAASLPVVTYPLAILLTVDALLILFYSHLDQYYSEKGFMGIVRSVKIHLEKWYLLPDSQHTVIRWAIVLLVVLLIPSARNLIFFVAKNIFKLLKLMPGPRTRAYIKRYLSIGRFSFRKKQSSIFDTLVRQYPPGMKFVVLPMDMDYMEAGTPKIRYREQLEELKELQRERKECLPFVFAHPMRLRTEATYYDEIVTLFGNGFRGIKTYPALGYYPFDQHLLPLMLWACENQVPVLNHCIRGTIYYRGAKEDQWHRHPVFTQSTGKKDESEPLLFFSLKNSEFSTQFTHPLNYLCLLDENYLKKLLIHYNDTTLNKLFGFTSAEAPLVKNLSRLKICFGHFGGDDEWVKYLESDRYHYENLYQVGSGTGINFTEGAIENIWKYASWFSVIYSLMLQYPNVYADISYILNNEKIFPLLKSILHPSSAINARILYGSDFYVVRSEKSDKQMWSETLSNLSESELYLLTRQNPSRFLYNSIAGAVRS